MADERQTTVTEQHWPAGIADQDGPLPPCQCSRCLSAEAIARKLCAWAEYDERNWRLYLQRARELLTLI